ncbi:Sensory neuron membrane protein 1 [Frankliniella fusca]|uniref:Sensory neuron membrane protein 1 n=1 Tax=Frankliniella fusca TaxID=407009 RepID=A0AAE1HIC7_9NEOP|nr:Sensory neuron membrane protein 1 [Frankliniella fusca]
MPAAMLAPLLTLALLPLALAACPCPPAPATDQVCGSDRKTYPSACDLDCTAPPGVAAVHPGPCLQVDALLNRLINATLLSSGGGRRARRSATEEKQKYNQCLKDRQCNRARCRECEEEDAHGGCMEMCWRNCECSCLGLQSSDLDYLRWFHCYTTERDCYGKLLACDGRCSTQECKDGCTMDLWRCKCGCHRQADGTTHRPWLSSPASP